MFSANSPNTPKWLKPAVIGCGIFFALLVFGFVIKYGLCLHGWNVILWTIFLAVAAGLITGSIYLKAAAVNEDVSEVETLSVLLIFFLLGIALVFSGICGEAFFGTILPAFQVLLLFLCAIGFVFSVNIYIKQSMDKKITPSNTSIKAILTVFVILISVMLGLSFDFGFSDPLKPTLQTEKDDSISRAHKKAAAIEAERLRMLRAEQEREEERLKQLRSGRSNQGNVTVTIPNYHDVVQVEEEQPQHYPAPNEQQNDPPKGHVPGH